ncbi:MAG TPA: membrane protein insertion efficiency factor YidD [Acidimicrobiales bacterium]|nr:membrane protein insertion efficiency factor YidD [Acidimicrobiales bacterium]
MNRAQPNLGERSSAAPGDEDRPGPAARMALSIIGVYQQYRAGRPTGCRYFPTCSAYADEAIRVHGAGRGTFLAVRRLMRCHPWGGHGVDPVPDRSPVCTH